ncbi:MAG: hypothetical protein II393_02745 [Cytophagales bacterium]|nr:hypothetical protein [Cytophagales bacterium]
MSKFNSKSLIAYCFFLLPFSTFSTVNENDIFDKILNIQTIKLTPHTLAPQKVGMCCDCCYNEDDILSALLKIQVTPQEVLNNAQEITYDAQRFKENIPNKQKNSYKTTIENDLNRIPLVDKIDKNEFKNLLFSFVDEGYHYLQAFGPIFAICCYLNIDNDNTCNIQGSKDLAYKLLFSDKVFLYKDYYFLNLSNKDSYYNKLKDALFQKKIFSMRNPMHESLSKWLIDGSLFTPIHMLSSPQKTLRVINLLLKHGSDINTNIVKYLYKRITKNTQLNSKYVERILFT